MTDPLNSNQSKNTIGIVMGTYNGEKYIAEQLESIINQTYQDWYLLVRDDGSTDNTVKILNEFARNHPRISILKDQDGNLGFNRNFLKLIALTETPYISICDQDDVWLPHKLTTSLQTLQAIEHTSDTPALVHSDAIIVDSNLNHVADKWIGSRGNIEGLNGIAFANSVQGASVMFNQALKKIALTTPPLAPYDYHLALLSTLKGKRYFINESLLKYRQHAHNAIGGMSTDDKTNNKHYLKKLINIFNSVLSGLDYNKLSPTLHHSFDAYKIIKSTYSQGFITAPQKEQLAEYLYILEGKCTLKKLYLFIKNKYGFSSKKDRIIFFFLIASGRNLTSPEDWK